ncbi:unnamed protein product [Ceratitis capitata]|uniref:(Mediterranean fruit fly) hypothetical protein n=1 Tax=Ceratitis capitata TaxID=7213 RepID=A0A811U5V5_CERCA|nr:unnamed protein product [Ceratitis capitata]
MHSVALFSPTTNTHTHSPQHTAHGQHLYCNFRTVMASPTQMAPFPYPLHGSKCNNSNNNKYKNHGNINTSKHTKISPQPHLRRLQGSCSTKTANVTANVTLRHSSTSTNTIRATLSLFCQFLTVYCILLTASGSVRMAQAQAKLSCGAEDVRAASAVNDAVKEEEQNDNEQEILALPLAKH